MAQSPERVAEYTRIVKSATKLPVFVKLSPNVMDITEPALAGVTLGQPARVKVDGRAEAFTGTVTYISPTAEFTPRNVQTPDERAKLVYRVKITLPNPDGIFKPGMPADGYLH